MAEQHDFAVWAPRAQQVTLIIEGDEYPMVADDQHWFRPEVDLPEFTGDVDYGYRLDGSDQVLPDPRSLRQPGGPHGLSRTHDVTAHQWGDDAWTGRQLAGASIYELHVGTFTPEGTLDSAIERLDHLADLGVDFVELMPVNGFNGDRGWGYDGVNWYTVHEPYGGPAAYQRFVDACHQKGIGVIQDVVYNHLGPSGNYLPLFGPYLSEGNDTPWGTPINLDGELSDEVRRYIIDNCFLWLRDYHVDGLRLDAVHALVDSRAIGILEEISTDVEVLSAHVGRPLTLIAESDLNNPRLITPREAGGFGLDAQWSDDFHHALIANVAGEESGYYTDFASLEALGKVLENGFFHDGTVSTFRGRRHGRRLDTPRTSTWRLVVCQDNHDQIGNRADGARLSHLVSTAQLEIAAVLTLLNPGTPMIFMGDEWGAATKWAFFTAHPEPELGAAVSQGRLAEFEKMDWDLSTVPDPQAPSTFTDSVLDWSELNREPHAGLLDLNRRLLALRRAEPDLTDPRFDEVSVRFAAEDSGERWLVVDRGQLLSVVVNFSAEPCVVELDGPSELLLSTGQAGLAETALGLGGHSSAVVRLLDEQR